MEYHGQPRHGYRFTYSPAILGRIAFWGSNRVRIARIMDPTDDSLVGQVRLAHPISHRIMGDTCISELVPIIGDEGPAIVPSKRVVHDDNSEDSWAESSLSDESDNDAVASRSDIYELRQMIDELRREVNELRANQQNAFKYNE